MKSPRTASPRSRTTATSAHLEIAYQLDALLHTMRALARAEEQLCSLMHSIEREGTLPARARRELLQLLQELPTDACDADRHAILDALGSSAAPVAPVPARRASQATRRRSAPATRKAARPPARQKASASEVKRRTATRPARQTTGGKGPPRKAVAPKAKPVNGRKRA